MSDEITEPTVHLCWNDFAIRGAVHALRMANLDAMADDMEAQLKPADPVEDLVQEFANRNWDVDDADDVRWKYFITPNRLREFAVEVLRVGIGEQESADEWQRLHVANAQTEAYTKGAEDFATKVRGEIAALRSKVVTGPEKRTCDDLLALVGVLQGLS